MIGRDDETPLHCPVGIPAQRIQMIVADIGLPSPDRVADVRTWTNPRTGICPKSWEVREDLQVLLSLKILPSPGSIASHSSAESRGKPGILSLSARISPDKWPMQFIHDQCPQNKTVLPGSAEASETHTMTACWRRVGPTLSCGPRKLAKIRGDRIRKPRLYCPAALLPCQPLPGSCRLSLSGQSSIPAAMSCFRASRLVVTYYSHVLRTVAPQ